MEWKNTQQINRLINKRKKSDNPKEKWTKDMNRPIDIQKVSKRMKR